MQMHTKIATGLMSAAMMSSLAFTGVAFAQTTGGTQGQGWGGHTGQHMPGVFGKVASISGTTITLTGRNNTTYTVDASNATVTKSGSTSSVSSIAVGDTLMVQGTVSGTSVTATSIHDGVGGPGGRGSAGFWGNASSTANRAGRGSGIMGTIASVSGTTITVTGTGPNNGTTYTVDASNAKVEKGNASSTISGIATGDTVMIQGTVSGTNVTATNIHDGKGGFGGHGRGGSGMGQANPIIQGNGQPVIGGSVTAISGSALTVTTKTNIVYSVDASAATIEKGHATSTLSSIATGDSVIVQGAVNGTNVTASSVIDSGAQTASGTQMSGSHGLFGGIMGGIGSFFHGLFGFF